MLKNIILITVNNFDILYFLSLCYIKYFWLQNIRLYSFIVIIAVLTLLHINIIFLVTYTFYLFWYK